MLAGLALTAGYVTWFEILAPERNVPASWWLGISPEGIGMVGMLVNVAVMVAVSRATKPPPDAVQELVAELRFPRAAAMGSGREGALR
jgi:cation/acetate symporter